VDFRGIGPFEVGLYVAASAISLYPFWRILRRMQWGRWRVVGWLAAFSIPGVSLLAWWYLAFTSWPVDDEQLRVMTAEQ